MRNHIKYTAIVSLGALVMAGCGRDDAGGDPAGRVAVEFGTGNIAALTRTAQDGASWVTGDATGIYMIGSGQTLGAATVIGGAANVEYTVTDPTTGSMSPADPADIIYYPQDGSPVDFIVYYPYTGALADNKYPVDVSDQRSVPDIDLLYSDNATARDKRSGPVALEFTHALSKFVINIKKGVGMESVDFDLMAQGVVMNGFPSTADLSLADGTTFTGVTTSGTGITMLAWDTPAPGFEATCQAIVIPQTGTNAGRTVVFTADREYVWTLADDVAFEQGKVHTWEVTVTKTGVDIGTATITPWDDSSQPVAGDASRDYALSIPDDAFRAYCLEQFDTDGDGRLSLAEVSAVTGISLSWNGISSLEGVQYFTNLQTLYCSNNSLASLDVSGCANLQVLYCQNNSLTSLDVSGCANLQTLNCYDNSLTSLDVSGCANLQTLNCNRNSLSSLDVSGCANLQTLSCYYNSLESLDVSGCANLQMLECYGNSLSSLDVSDCLRLTQINCGLSDIPLVIWTAVSQDLNFLNVRAYPPQSGSIIRITAKDDPVHNVTVSDGPVNYALLIPDANFRAYCLAQFDNDGDTRLSLAEVLAVTQIDVSYSGISSLEGIQYFTNLRTLDCSWNSLTSLDISGCANLQTLNCSYNFSLASLDVSGCANLQTLNCNDNSLASLDVSGCANLQTLYCNDNSLESLDVSGCANLLRLVCYDNSLASLDVSGCADLQTLSCDLNSLVSLDVSGCADLQTLSCDNNPLEFLDISGCANLQTLYCCYNPLESLDVSMCLDLQELYCYDNSITLLDVSKCLQLTYIECGMSSTPLLILTDMSQNLASLQLMAHPFSGGSATRITAKDQQINNVTVRDKQ